MLSTMKDKSNKSSGGAGAARASKGPMAWAGAAHSQGQALHEPHAIAQAFNANVPMRIKQGKAEVGDEAVRAARFLFRAMLS